MEIVRTSKPLIIATALAGLTAAAWLLLRPAEVPLRPVTANGETALAGRPAKSSNGASANAAVSAPSIAVEAAAVTPATAALRLRAIGTLQSEETVQVASEIAGRVTEVTFEEGKPVSAGDVLVKLDDALAQAEVTDAEARYEFATGNLTRANTLARSGNVTERARDEATANSATARAALELAKVRLAKHVMRAPFSGFAGIRKVSPGAYVAVGQPLVNVEKIDTLKVDFKLPELYLAEVHPGQTIEVEVDALPGRKFEGTIYAIDPMVDVNGRALSIRSKLPNPDLVLRPGLFARITVKGTEGRKVVVVPESAIVPRGTEKIVYAVEGGRAVESKVQLGERRGGMVEVVGGLKLDAMVVTAGQQKLKDGTPVEIVARDTALERGKGG